jgi:hypothetical protein
MYPKTITQTGTGASAWIPVDYKQAPFNLSLAAIVVSGTATYNVEYTYDNVLAGATATAWVVSALSAQTTSKDTALSAPVRAVRLNVTAGSSPVVSLTIMQSVARS